ncbi:MAG: hypothetical protein Tsb0013_12500 [Phycisphaerales bacterium]
MRTRLHIMMLALLTLFGGEALAQFNTPGSTMFRERITGELREGGEQAITPEAGDQIGAFFQDEIVGLFTFTDGSRDFSITLFGDNPNTEVVEGPDRGDRVVFRFFDGSTNQTLDLTVLNPQGEAFNFTFQGVEVIDVPGLPIDLTPTRQFDLRAGAPTGGGGGGGGGGGDAPGGGMDINGDGRMDVRDAAIVLRALGGAVRPGSRAFRDLGIAVSYSDGDGREAETGAGVIELSADDLLSRCDVNGDGLVTSRDAVMILTSGRGG